VRPPASAWARDNTLLPRSLFPSRSLGAIGPPFRNSMNEEASARHYRKGHHPASATGLNDLGNSLDTQQGFFL